MTENQTKQMMKMMTQCVSGIQQLQVSVKKLEEGQIRLEVAQAKLESEVSDLKEGQIRLQEGQSRLENDVSDLKIGQSRVEKDVAELKEGQIRVEKGVDKNNKVFNKVAGDNLRLEARIEILEDKLEMSI